MAVFEFGFVGHHAVVVEVVGQSRALEFIELILQFAFGEDYHFEVVAVGSCVEGYECVFNTGQGCGGKGEQRASHLHHFLDDARTHSSVGHSDGRFDERQGEGFCAITKGGHVAFLSFK